MKFFFWLWFALIAVASLLPKKSVGNMHVIISNSGFWEHTLAYSILSILGCWAFPARKVGIILTGVFGASVGFEFIQRWLLNRTFNPMDILANGIGIITGIFLYIVCRLGYRMFLYTSNIKYRQSDD